MRVLILSISMFALLVTYQNCSQVSEAVPGVMDEGYVGVGSDQSTDGDGDINCMAIPIPHMRLGFVFTPDSSVPAKVELKINNEVVYSDCVSGPQLAMAQRPGQGRLELYREFLDDNAYSSMDMRLYKVNSCDNDSKEEIFSANETPNYEPNVLCGKTSYKLVVDYLVN